MEDNELTPEEEEAIMAYLEDVGAMEWVGMHDSGDRIMKPNLEKLKEFAPEIYEVMIDELNKDLMALYEKGLIEISYDSITLEPTFIVSEEGIKAMEQLGFQLNKDEEND